MANIIQRVGKTFFFLTLSYFVLGFVLLLTINKGDAVLFLNQLHNPCSDLFFKYFTHLGSGQLAGILFFIFLFFAPLRKTFVVGTSFALMGILTQFLKKIIFPQAGRPHDLFWMEMDKMNLVEGVVVRTDFSFPSGHTAAGYIIALVLVWSLQKKVHWAIIFFAIATTVGISRIYLFQHFLIDTYFGTLLSFLIGYSVIWYFEQAKWVQKDWTNHSMIQLLRSKKR